LELPQGRVEAVLLCRHGAVAELIVVRPDRLNAIVREVSTQPCERLEWVGRLGKVAAR
jgi:hypothetical protein